MSTIQELQDRFDVSDVIVKYAFALDQREWSELEAVYDDEILIDLPHLESDPYRVSRSELLDLIKAVVLGFDATHHLIPNHLITIDGDDAVCKAYAHAWHTVPTDRGVADFCLVRGFYDWGLRRTSSGWRINRMIVKAHGPVDGYVGVYKIAAARVAEGAV